MYFSFRINEFGVVLGRGRSNGKPNNAKDSTQSASDPQEGSSMANQAQWNVIPHLRRGLNRGQASIRRHPSQQQAQPSKPSPWQEPRAPERPETPEREPDFDRRMSTSSDESPGPSQDQFLAVEPVQDSR